MAWQREKTGTGSDLVWSGGELGIAPSPTKGTANMQNVNIATESGQILASYNRTNQAQLAIASGTMVPDGSSLLDVTASAALKAGTWIRVLTSTISGISATTSPTTADLDYLVVGGGGGGGGANSSGDNSDASGGGGGAGAVVAGTTAISPGTYPVVIGNGGDGGATTPTAGTNGEDSTLGVLVTAPGGGGGGSSDAASDDGLAGGSGGGGGGDDNGSTFGTGGVGTPDNNGGDGASGKGGGGGGANAAGAAASSDGGDGGNGISSSISGSAVFYGGGGGGGDAGGVSPSGGIGGDGGGGTGGNTTGSSVQTAPTAGTANTGGGGGGAGTSDTLDMAGESGGSGIVIVSYDTGSMVATGGDDMYTSGGKTIHVFRTNGAFTVHSVAQDGLYYVSYSNAAGNEVRLSTQFDPTGANSITHGTTGSLTFETLVTPAQGVAKATEKYTTATQTGYRYYIMDSSSYLWVFDSLIYDTYGTQWMLPDPLNYSGLRFTGIGALNGMLLAVSNYAVFGKPTPTLGVPFNMLTNSYLNEPFPTHNNFALVGNQGKLYYCDGNYLGEVFATTSLETGIANIQSVSTYAGVGTVGTISAVIAGSLPYDPGGTRIPVVFYTSQGGTLPSAINENQVYYLEYNPSSKTFEVFTQATGGTARNVQTGATGTQYFTTFWPYGTQAGYGGTNPLVQISSQRVNLPSNETAQTMVEIGNFILIGGNSNVIYPWNQTDATPSDFITLPESNIRTMINVNNIAYVFAGNKGNIYVTNGSTASLALKVPDYCAGVPGTPITYIEPVFSWGDSEYVRGRVYFSIMDQTVTKAGNCGGVWSFVPAQNVDPSQDIGMALRLENQSSYGTYSGVANLIIGSMEQDVTSPQYWASWQSSYSLGTSTFGIDFTGTVPVTTYVVETDLIPTGTHLEKQTYQQLEYKLATPLAVGDSLQLYYRLNATDAWQSCGTISEETDNRLSGLFKANFQKTQWTQFRAVATTTGTAGSSFVRLTELRLR